MAWGDFPDKGAGLDNVQSILFAQYLDKLGEGVRGLNCVLSGCVVGS